MADISSVSRFAGGGSAAVNRPVAGNEEEAAREFEKVLVKQFVQVMTKDLFKSIDDDASADVGAYGDIQRDALTDVLTEHLVDSGTFKLQDLLLRQWARQAAADNIEG